MLAKEASISFGLAPSTPYLRAHSSRMGSGVRLHRFVLCTVLPPTPRPAQTGAATEVAPGMRPSIRPNNPAVQEYLDFMAALRRVPQAEQRVDAVIERMHLEDRSESYIGRLSKGLRQRVGLAQALLNQPEVLILDEPTIGLDPAQVVEVRELIREIGRDHTVLLSTHILSEAQQICQRVLIINKGRIVAEDTPERLQSRLAGAERIAVRVAGEAPAAEGILRKVRGVISVATRGPGQFEVETASGTEARPAIARALVKNDLDVLELHTQGISLEDIFLELTRSESGTES